MSAVPKQKPQDQLAIARGITAIDDALSFDMAGILVSDLRKRVAEIEARYRPAVEQAHKAHKALTSQRAEETRPYREEAARLSDLLSEYARRAELERKEQEARMTANLREQFIAAGVAPEDANAAAVTLPPLGAPVGMVQRDTFSFEIIDQSQLPREYLIPNEAAIAEAVRQHGKTTNIPGVRVFVATTFARKGGEA